VIGEDDRKLVSTNAIDFIEKNLIPAYPGTEGAEKTRLTFEEFCNHPFITSAATQDFQDQHNSNFEAKFKELKKENQQLKQKQEEHGEEMKKVMKILEEIKA